MPTFAGSICALYPVITPASSSLRTRSAVAGADNPTRRPSSLEERRESFCSSRMIFQSVLSSGLSDCKAMSPIFLSFCKKYSIFLLRLAFTCQLLSGMLLFVERRVVLAPAQIRYGQARHIIMTNFVLIPGAL